jgi:hypothetical protein
MKHCNIISPRFSILTIDIYFLLCFFQCNCRYPEYRVPHIQASSQDNGSRLSAQESSGAATCPRGSGSRLPTRWSSRAATWHLDSSTHHLAHGSSGVATCPKDEFCKPQANKQIPPDDQAIMISIGARTRVSFKTLRDKG